jgi:hypothetical protein
VLWGSTGTAPRRASPSGWPCTKRPYPVSTPTTGSTPATVRGRRSGPPPPHGISTAERYPGTCRELTAAERGEKEASWRLPEDHEKVGEATAEERARNESSQKERAAHKRAPGRQGGLHARISRFKLDTETEQTAKASYYLTPEQTKKLDELRAAFRHEGGYAPRDASYSRIVGLAIEHLHEEIFSSGSRG